MRKALDAAVEAIGGQPREGQIEMAEAVANALSDRHHLLVQAGTGTGKSLAYLVPALVHVKKVLVYLEEDIIVEIVVVYIVTNVALIIYKYLIL